MKKGKRTYIIQEKVRKWRNYKNLNLVKKKKEESLREIKFKKEH